MLILNSHLGDLLADEDGGLGVGVAALVPERLAEGGGGGQGLALHVIDHLHVDVLVGAREAQAWPLRSPGNLEREKRRV
jgi:hypothetical protein